MKVVFIFDTKENDLRIGFICADNQAHVTMSLQAFRDSFPEEVKNIEETRPMETVGKIGVV